MKGALSSDILLKLVRFELRQANRKQSCTPASSPPPRQPPVKRYHASDNCWIRSGSECQFNFQKDDLNGKRDDCAWVSRINQRSKQLNSTLRCKYSAPSEFSKRRIVKETSELEDRLRQTGGLVEPGLDQQNCADLRFHERKFEHKPFREKFSSSNVSEEGQRPIAHCHDYKRIAFFRRMKLALKKTNARQVLEFEPVTRQSIINRGRQQPIAPWETPEEGRSDLLSP